MNSKLTQIRKGMPVFDREGKKIGSVKVIHFGDENPQEPGVNTETAQTPDVSGNEMIEIFARAISDEGRVPEEARERFQRYGFLKVNTGILIPDRYVSADQIAHVSANRVDLNATLRDLVAA